ncbi:MAG: class II aldolase/adducin family protein [Chloroflexi bacterium]|nr:class II aldolase/adducin family protein [Chloroflexota bacterium]
MVEEELKTKTALCCHLMEAVGLINYDGHVSARIPGTDRIVINARARGRATLEAKDMVVIDLEGKGEAGAMEPPGETPIHTSIYRQREDVDCVAHLHPHYSTLLSIAGHAVEPVFFLGTSLGPVPVFAEPGHVYTRAQGQALAETLGQHRAVLIRGHGSVVVGGSIEEVFVLAIYMEENCKKQYYASLLGPPRVITSQEVERVAPQVWKPSSVAKVWNYYVEKYRAGLLTAPPL